MRLISFFSEKGGVGKSTFSIMYASWLQYKHGVRVGLADFNERISGYRNAEIANRNYLIRKNPDAGHKPFSLDGAWPIDKPAVKDINDYKRNAQKMPYYSWLRDHLNEGPLSDREVIICDFPGSLSGGEFMEICGMRMLDLIVIPTEKDEMTIQSTARLVNLLKKGVTPYCIFINRVNLGLKSVRSSFLALGPALIRNGFPVLPDMVSNSDRITTIDKVDNIRSTFGFPDFEQSEYGPTKDLGIENLFIDITRLLDSRPDLPGTAPADLSFVRSMAKTDDGRQFKGSSFPEFEL